MIKHPITPPPELFAEWVASSMIAGDGLIAGEVAIQAARWGADQELDACCEWLRSKDILEPAIDALRAARRKPPSLKAEVRQIIECLIEGDCVNDEDAVTLRRALEALPNV